MSCGFAIQADARLYGNAGQRAVEIEQSAAQSAATLRADAVATAAALDAGLTRLDGEQWDHPVRSALGRGIPAAEVPWMRVRDVWLHAVDLDTGASTNDLPVGAVDLLADDVTAALSAKPGCPRVLLAPTDRDRTWTLGDGRDAATLRAPAAAIVGWLTGPPRRAGAAAARGLSNQDIATSLTISLSTVKTHVNRVLTKLGAQSRAQAVVTAYETGLIQPGDPH